VSTAEPQRRRSDARPPRSQPFGPTPGGLAPPDPEGVMRSLELAVESARRIRRAVTLIAMELAPPADERALAQVASLVRHTVRDTDGLWRDGASGLVLVLTDVDGPNSEPALARLRLRLRAEGFGAALMGRAAAAPGISAVDLLALAREDRRVISYGSGT
jgi:hypothetical protein